MNEKEQRGLATEVRILRKKLHRAEINLRRAERRQEMTIQLHKGIIEDLTEVRDQLTEKNHQLENATLLLRESEQHAFRANQAKSTFLANVSHELRTPLNAIIGYSELILEASEDDNCEGGTNVSFAGELDAICSAGRHLLGLISDVLDVSKIEAGKFDLECTRYRVQPMLDAICGSIRPAVNTRGLQFEFEADVPPTTWGDETRTRQVLLNLLSNAVKFTEGGSVKMRAWREGERLVYEVTDTGIGIPADKLDRVFEPFTQADSSHTRQYGGTGLGLSISRSIAEEMHGSLTVSSIYGEGSTFRMELPHTDRQSEVETPICAGIRSDPS